MLDKKCHIFNWVLGYPILSKFLEEFLDRSDDSITHIEHIIKINIEVGNPPFVETVQCSILILYPSDKSGI